MAILSNALGTALRLVVQTGADAAGNPVLKNRSYNRVKPGAGDQAVYDAAVALAGLQQYPLQAVERVDQRSLVQVS